jgi:hypothetical protein
MDQGQKRLQSLGGQEISDLFSDELSDVPSDIFSDTDTDSGDDRKKKEFCPQKVKVNVKLKTAPMKVRGQPHG